MSNKKLPSIVRNLIIMAIVAGVLIGFAWFINQRADRQRLALAARSYEGFGIPQGSVPVEGETLVAENDRLTMHLDPETLGVTLTSKATGEVFHSVVGEEDDQLNTQWRGFLGSGVSIDFYSGDSPQSQRADMFTRNPSKHFYLQEDGFDAYIVYDALQFAFKVVVRLTEDGFTAEVPAYSVHEGEQFRLGGVYLYPFMGATRLAEEPGYMLIPEGSGALIDLRNNMGRFRSPYIKKIYGEDIANTEQISQPFNLPSIEAPKEVSLPIYGIAHTDRQMAFLAIAESGKEHAELMAYPNGVATDFNWAGIKFIYREDAITQLSRGTGIRAVPKAIDLRDVSIRFNLLEGDDADYVGMAQSYRAYLYAQGALKDHEDPFKVRLDFLGAESEPWLLFDRPFAMTTVADLGRIIDDLTSQGLTALQPTLMGWQKGGLSRSYGTASTRMDGTLGSWNALEALNEQWREQGIHLNLHQDLLLANPKGNFDSSTDIVKDMSRKTAVLRSGFSLYPDYNYLTPFKATDVAASLLDRVEHLSSTGLTISGLSDTLYSYYDDGAMIYRAETARQSQETLAMFSNYETALIQPFDYLLPYASAYYDLPINASNYNYVSQEIPFLPIVLKGALPYYSEYVNFEANPEQYYLKLVEYGAYPSFLLTQENASKLKDSNSASIYTSSYDDFSATIVERYQQFQALNQHTAGAAIVDHETVAPGVIAVTYNNGKIIYINYASEPRTVEAVTIDALSYEVVG